MYCSHFRWTGSSRPTAVNKEGNGRASGFEPPISWSRTTVQRIFSNLQGIRAVAHSCELSRVVKGLRNVSVSVQAMEREPSKRGVGTKMGTGDPLK